jgi:hypothetical protein
MLHGGFIERNPERVIDPSSKDPNVILKAIAVYAVCFLPHPVSPAEAAALFFG